jgi:predicted Rossmann fold nucleotide-binding protein DprA/Smf involved in DNA uptake
MSDQNKEMLKDGKLIVKNAQDIIDAMGRFDELCANWDDDHPLMEAATNFVDYVSTKMKEIDPQLKETAQDGPKDTD